MTYAPNSVKAVASVIVGGGFINSGIIGDSAHAYGYHCGRDRVYGPNGRGDADYSVQQPRDKAGLTNAAMALDLGSTDKPKLRAYTKALMDACIAKAPDTRDIREIIGTIDGIRVVGWSALSPASLIPNYGDSSHLWHTHISWFRDAEYRDLTPLFKRLLAPSRSHSLVIGAGAKVMVATVSNTGCIASWSTQTWGATPSSAPCEAPVSKPGCISGSATVAKVTSGMFAGKWVRVGDGVTVKENP